MNIIGTLFVIDAPHIDLLKYQLANNLPPMGMLTGNRLLCMDMDETTEELEQEFPNHCMKATILCPPPIAMYKEIDGDQEGFIEAYYDYLDHEESVQEFIATMLLFMHVGGNIILYTPAYMEDDPVWMHTLIMFFYSRYGITIGTSAQNGFFYDQNYDNVISDILYKRKMIDVIDYVNSTTYYPYPPLETYGQVMQDLSYFAGPGENPYDMFLLIKNSFLQNGVPVIKPALIFDQ